MKSLEMKAEVRHEKQTISLFAKSSGGCFEPSGMPVEEIQ